MLNKLRVRVQEEKGFTLVELLVVMLILGLLAAIAIPAFFNQRDKAKDADAKAAARTAQTAIETYRTDNQGSATGATVDILQEIEPTLNDVADVNMALANLGDDTYSVSVTEPDTTNVFTIERLANGQTQLTCTTQGEAGCPQNGNWG